ncbi:NAD(P)-binding protein [Piedraia hortae CBS 480.64]|uniref:NAD(P)-binding protein n=1 Tax=Piedraia hortae CBS 480.64 TaxID=1314780 RepID=A0A6A7BSN5_9PEZI|nr:NAD(P)-binding protein [Piedraia hortae CBS 480.64]
MPENPDSEWGSDVSIYLRSPVRLNCQSRTMSSSNQIKNVAVIGAGGNSGTYMTKELLKTGKHTVTAITRAGSDSKLPEGIHRVAKVDYANPSSLLEALTGQDALVITLGTFVPPETDKNIIEAAVKAKVRFILPNEWAPDTANEGLRKDVGAFAGKEPIRKKIEAEGKGVTSYIAVSTGFWFEWSLAIPAAFGFDFDKKAVTMFDDGETKINTSTWPQVGRAVAKLLSLPIQADGDPKACLDHYKNKQVYVSSFNISQKDMLAAAMRVTNTKKEDWKVSYESSKERYENGVNAMKEGDNMGFVRMMYTRVFYKDDSGNFEKTKGTINSVLGLPQENLDEATAEAIKRSQETQWTG